MEATKQDKRMQRGNETYHNLIKCAMEIIAESGVGSLSAAKLAELAGISKSNVFHHFSSVRDIPEAVLHHIFDEMSQPMALGENKNLYENLLMIGENYFKAFSNSQKWLRCFFSFYYEGLFHKVYREILSRYLNESKSNVAEMLKSQVKNKISDKEADLYASMLIVTLDGMGMQMLLLEDCEVYFELWKEQVKLICSELENNHDIS